MMKRPTGSAGFTLMETLVMLIVSALAVTLMFQALASFSRSHERVAALEGVRDSDTVVLDWLRDSIRGLVSFDPTGLTLGPKDAGQGLQGDASGFSATTLAPLLHPTGGPVVVQWRVAAGSTGSQLVYQEPGQKPLTLTLHDVHSMHFGYLDKEGKTHAHWPPRLGLQEALPDTVELIIDGDSGVQVLAQAIATPRPMKLTPYSNGDDL